MAASQTLAAIASSAAVPTIPIVAVRCIEMTNDPRCSYDKLVDSLSTEPGSVAEILRLVNSGAFGHSRKISSLRHAVTLLGLNRVRALVLAHFLVQSIGDSATDLIDINYFWRRCMMAGVLASRLARTFVPAQRDEAFISGLFADVGVVVLARAMPERYAPIAKAYGPNSKRDLSQAECDILGVCHGDVSAMVLEKWNLPEAVVDAVRHHHDLPDACCETCACVNLCRVVGGGTSIAEAFCEWADAETLVVSCACGMDRMGIDFSVLTDALEGIEHDVEGVAALLEIEVLDHGVFEMIDGLRESAWPACD